MKLQDVVSLRGDVEELILYLTITLQQTAQAGFLLWGCSPAKLV